MKRNAWRLLPCAIACLAAAACSSNSSDNVVVTTIAPGAQCANGGVSITVNGGSPQVVCSGPSGSTGATGSNGATGANGGTGATGATGASGYTTLVKTTSLPPGDTNCPNGGEEVDSGLDNGAGGGVANDGILQPGEITSTSFICNNGDEHIGSITPPGGAAGTFTINAKGGDASDAGAGSGAMVDLRMNNGTVGGNVMIFATGQADPSFTFPAEPSPTLGANPASVTGSVNVGALSNLAGDAGPGTLVLDGSNNLSTLLEDGGVSEVTSLTVAADATLIRNDDAEDTIPLTVNGACINSGTITASDSASELIIACNGYFGAVGSSITNNGANGPTGATGASGPTGSVGGSSAGVILYSDALYNHGAIQANGGAGSIGGNAGPIFIGYNQDNNEHNGTPLYNDGAIQAAGGSGNDGNGGNGSSISLGGSGDVNNAGAIDSHGGDGTTSGGNGGEIVVEGGWDYIGSVHNSGAVTSSGGASLASCTAGQACTGGSGGTIELYVDDGVLVSNAALTSHGGVSVGGPGGSGGSIQFTLNGFDSSPNGGGNESIPSGDITVSGNLDSSGGSGSSGGSAGGVSFSYETGSPNGQQIILYGYASVNVSGGSGLYGGNAGCFGMSNTEYDVYYDNRSFHHTNYSPIDGEGPGGSVVNYASIIARGGTGAAATETGDDSITLGGNGGNGGNTRMQTQSSYWFPNDTFEQVYSEGTIDTTGGDGSSGGNNGEIYLYGIGGANSVGAITARTGNGLSGSAGGYNDVLIFSDYGIANSSGAIDVTGGASTATIVADVEPAQGNENMGGQGGQVQVHGYTATVSGTITATGGAPAGSGGSLDVQSIGGGQSTVSIAAPAGINVSPGSGTIADNSGIPGTVDVDGWDVTSAWTF